MENKDLFYQILKKLDENNVLKDIILIGSWTLHIYKSYFNSEEIPIKRTLDVDFLIPNPPKIKNKINVPELFKKLNFNEIINKSDNYIKFVHPDLEVEFLINQKAKIKSDFLTISILRIIPARLPYLSHSG